MVKVTVANWLKSLTTPLSSLYMLYNISKRLHVIFKRSVAYYDTAEQQL